MDSPGDRRLVDRGLAGDDLAIHRNLLAWAHDDDVPDLNLGNGHLLFDAVVLHARNLGRHGGQVLDGAARAFGREFLSVVAYAHKEDDHGRRT